MACTTILVGRNASYDGSTMIARNDDSGAGHYTAKKFVVVRPEDQPRIYVSKISHVRIPLPADPMRYTATPNAVKGKDGIWAAAGINEANVAMTATETITSNARVLGADPLVEYHPARAAGSCAKAEGEAPSIDLANTASPFAQETEQDPEAAEAEQTGGIGEEDIVAITLPYIHSAREGVLRLGSLLEQYGTYEMNGIAFSDKNEIWWLETIGGHHWMARRVPDDCYVAMPNQLGLDEFDFRDAYGSQKNYLCSADLRDFAAEYRLDLATAGDQVSQIINPRLAFGSRDDADHVYNTPRAWYIEKRLNPHTCKWDGPEADFRPDSDDIPWCRMPEHKITVEDVKYLLSSHFQGTPYDPYMSYGDRSEAGKYRSIGVNRTDFLALLQIRGYLPDEIAAVEWLAMASNVFAAFTPFYTNVTATPAYMNNTGAKVDTHNYYWSARLVSALADAQFGKCQILIERYQDAVAAQAHQIVNGTDRAYLAALSGDSCPELLEAANEKLAAMLEQKTDEVLSHVLYETSNMMKNQYARSDA